MADRRDLSGVWYGRYSADGWNERNGFIALLDDLGGPVTGTITERDTMGIVPIRRAVLIGERSGGAFAFTKQYDGTGGHVHALRYEGLIDAEATTIAGRWSMDMGSGRFTMEREKFSAEALEREEETLLRIKD